MSNVEEYRAAVQACVLAASILAPYDVPRLLRAIDHADAVGPILNPTLWIQKQGAMGEDREVLEAALPLWRLTKKLSKMPACPLGECDGSGIANNPTRACAHLDPNWKGK
jgi:hypothetical protein